MTPRHAIEHKLSENIRVLDGVAQTGRLLKKDLYTFLRAVIAQLDMTLHGYPCVVDLAFR
ncbi:MAG: hypothetical protein ACYTBV_21095 [Planctomycetota bacterium]|jgi:hypothetical protein